MLTPETIASRRFDKQMGGYKQDEVEEFLQQVAAEYAQLLSEKEELEGKIEVLAEKVEQYREDEDSLRSALIGAQKLGDSVIRESKAKADQTLREARAKADQILENAQKSIEREQLALIKMQKEVTKFKNRLLTLYRQHLEMISALPEYDEEPEKPAPAPEPEHQQPAPRQEEPAPQPEPEPAPQPVEKAAEPEPERTKPSAAKASFEEEDGMIDFTSALSDEMEDTTSFAVASAQNAPAPRESALAASRQRAYSPFGANSIESKFGPLKFGEGFDVERDSDPRTGLFSRKKHRDR